MSKQLSLIDGIEEPALENLSKHILHEEAVNALRQIKEIVAEYSIESTGILRTILEDIEEIIADWENRDNE